MKRLSVVGSTLLTVSLGENILGRLSKVNVSGRYSHYL